MNTCHQYVRTSESHQSQTLCGLVALLRQLLPLPFSLLVLHAASSFWLPIFIRFLSYFSFVVLTDDNSVPSLLLTRIESGEKVRRITQVDIIEVTQSGIETIAPAAANRNITIELHHNDPIHLQGDYSEIAIILNNLLSNAEKYNEQNGRIDITLHREKDHLIITVADQGIGMTQQEQDKLFHDFVRIKNSKTKGILGSGLGLSIVKKLVHLYNGEITLQSAPGQGTTFTLLLKDAPIPDKN